MGHTRSLVPCNLLSPAEFSGDQWEGVDPFTAISFLRCSGSLLKDSGKIMEKIFSFAPKGKIDERNDY